MKPLALLSNTVEDWTKAGVATFSFHAQTHTHTHKYIQAAKRLIMQYIY